MWNEPEGGTNTSQDSEIWCFRSVSLMCVTEETMCGMNQGEEPTIITTERYGAVLQKGQPNVCYVGYSVWNEPERGANNDYDREPWCFRRASLMCVTEETMCGINQGEEPT